MAGNSNYLRTHFHSILKEYKNQLKNLATSASDHQQLLIAQTSKLESNNDDCIFLRFFQKSEFGFEIGHLEDQKFVKNYYSLKDHENLVACCQKHDGAVLNETQLYQFIKSKHFPNEPEEKLSFLQCIEFILFETWFNKIIGFSQFFFPFFFDF